MLVIVVHAASVDTFNFSFRFECPTDVSLFAEALSAEKCFSAVCKIFDNISTSSGFGDRQSAA